MGTALREGNLSSGTEVSLGVLFDGKWKMGYDNHTVDDTFPCGGALTSSLRGGVFLSGK
jgi:hypothetical protein